MATPISAGKRWQKVDAEAGVNRFSDGLPTIHEERRWRLPDILISNRPKPSIIASRWTGNQFGPHTSEITGDYHTVSVVMEPTQLSLWSEGKEFQNKSVTPGAIQVTGPAQRVKSVFHGPYDILHLHIQNAFIRECVAWSQFGREGDDILIRDPSFEDDKIIAGLAKTLLSAGEVGGPFGPLCADSVGLAIVARLLNLYGEYTDHSRRKRVSPLPKWRLRRTIEFIKANVGGPIALADLAAVAGLTRMHFAAQFREATRLTPHQYILWYRIERAKELLSSSQQPIVHVAFNLGFSSQSHFTVVFRRFAGLTPSRWRHSAQTMNQSLVGEATDKGDDRIHPYADLTTMMS